MLFTKVPLYEYEWSTKHCCMFVQKNGVLLARSPRLELPQPGGKIRPRDLQAAIRKHRSLHSVPTPSSFNEIPWLPRTLLCQHR